ncbi:hypothetical protein [Hyphomicrobium sp. NDB2Meth4]|uniref:hypothetical protein n=1 Tax=Hyphomicrobium sp. NDB2Meth4 TaxID=1892846 RepID=UPI0009316057|nr:hypothetical protein [Hyphomicrobium sp. NDB2Meth4]
MSVDSIGPARRRTFTPYVLLYLLAATLAGAYLVFLGVRPDLIAMWKSKPDQTQTALVETQRTVERALADIDPLKQGVGEVKADLASFKAGLDEAAERDRILMEKLETLERLAAEKAAAAAKPAKTATAPAKKPAAATTIETGSIETKKPAAAAKPPEVGVLLATGPSLDALRLSWSILNDRASDTVRSLHPRYVVSGKDNERTYGLVAGPLPTIADAKAVCKVMSDRGMACEVSQFRGNSF